MLNTLMKSKYFRITLLCVVVLHCVLGVWIYSIQKSQVMPAEAQEMEEYLDGIATVVLGGNEAEDIRILNGEDGYFAIKNKGDDEYHIVNIDGRRIDKYERIGEKVGNYVPVYDGAWQVLDVRSLDFALSTGYKEMTLAVNGTYVIGKNVYADERIIYEVRTLDNQVLYTSEQELLPTENEGYVIEGTEDGNRVILLEDQTVAYQAGEFETITEGKGGFWKVFYEETWTELSGKEYFTCEYVLDENFQICCEGQLWIQVFLTDYAVVGDAMAEPNIWNDIEEAKKQDWYTSEAKVYFKDGGKSQDWSGTGAGICGVTENYLILTTDGCSNHKYYDLSKERTTSQLLSDFKSKEGICCMDFADGYSPASVAKYSWDGSTLVGSPSADSSKNTDRDWTYMDENLKPITKYVFQSVSVVDGGYGVVATEEGVFLIDFYQRGEGGAKNEEKQ